MGKGKKKKMVHEMLSFLEGRFGGQSLGWGSGVGWGWTWKLKHNPQCSWGFCGEKGTLVALTGRI